MIRPVPCPGCGGADIYIGPSHSFGYHARCEHCGLRTRDFNLPDYSARRNWRQRLMFAALNAWNMRAPVKPMKPSTKKEKHVRDEAVAWLRRPHAMNDAQKKRYLAMKWGKAIADEVWLMKIRKLI